MTSIFEGKPLTQGLFQPKQGSFGIHMDLRGIHPIVAPDLMQQKKTIQKTGVIKRDPFGGNQVI